MNKWKLIVAVLVILIIEFFIAYKIGYENKRAIVEAETVTYEELVKSIERKQSVLDATEATLKEKNDELDKVTAELSNNEDKLNRLTELEKNRDEMAEEISQAESTLEGLKNEIEEAEDELAKLQGGIKEAEGSPITLGAGQYTVGKDLPPNRYKAEPVSGSGNLFVDPGDGDYTRDVGVTLGDYDTAEKSYVVELIEGDKIRLGTSVRFTPVE